MGNERTMSNISLQAMLKLVDQASAPLKKIRESSDKVSDALKKQRNELDKLNRTQSNISSYKNLRNAVKSTRVELAVAKATVAQLSEEYKNTAKPTKKMTKELEQAKATLEGLKQKQKEQLAQLQLTRKNMADAGVNTKSLARDEKHLKDRITETTAALQKRKKHLENISNSQQRIKQIQSSTGHGIGMVMAGAGVLYQMKNPLNENKKMDIEENRISALGLGKEATKEAIDFAKAMKTFGTSTLDNVQLMRDGITAFADVHHAEWVAPTLAKMKFANETMYGGEQGHENERKFMDMLKVIEMRNGLKSQEAFKEQANIIQQVITATGGRVQGSEWLNAIKTGGLAVKGMSNEAFYYKLEPLVQEMGGHRVGTALMSSYQNLYQGKTTKRSANKMLELGLLSDPSKLKHDKAGQISFLDVGAIKGAELFRKDQFAWMEEVLLPTLAKKGITKEKDVLDAMGAILSNRTASNILSQMYLQRNQIHKNAKLNAGADGIDALDDKAKNTTAGKEIELRAKLHDFYLEFGKTILPAYTKAVELASKAFQGLNSWMQNNPRLAKAVGTGLLIIGVGLVAIGGLVAVFAPLLLGMLSMRFAMTALSGGGSVLGGVMKFLFSPFSKLIKLFSFLRLALFANPFGLFIGFVIIAALLVYKYWEPIKAFFSGFWDGLMEGLAPLKDTISTTFSNIKTACAPLIEIWNKLVDSILKFLSPIQATNDELEKVNATGYIFGAVYGEILKAIVKRFLGMVEVIVQVINWIMIFKDTVSSIYGFIESAGQYLGNMLFDGFLSKLRTVIEHVNSLIQKINSIPALNLNIPLIPQIPQVQTQSNTASTVPIKPMTPFKRDAQVSNVTHVGAPQIFINGAQSPAAVGHEVGRHLTTGVYKQNRGYGDTE